MRTSATPSATKKYWTPVKKQLLSPARKRKLKNLESSPDNILNKNCYPATAQKTLKNRDLDGILDTSQDQQSNWEAYANSFLQPPAAPAHQSSQATEAGLKSGCEIMSPRKRASIYDCSTEGEIRQHLINQLN
jgi:hypothetical protein